MHLCILYVFCTRAFKNQYYLTNWRIPFYNSPIPTRHVLYKYTPLHLFFWGETRRHGGSTPCAWAAAGMRIDGCICSCSCLWWWCWVASPPENKNKRQMKNKSVTAWRWGVCKSKIELNRGSGKNKVKVIDEAMGEEEKGVNVTMLIKKVRGWWSRDRLGGDCGRLKEEWG